MDHEMTLSLQEQHDVLSVFPTALVREAHVLTTRPDLIWEQLYNRLQWSGEAVRRQLEPQLGRRQSPLAHPWLHTRNPLRESEKLIRTLDDHTDDVTHCAISPDGTWILSASRDSTLKIWRAADGQLIRTLEDHQGGVFCCDISPDGRWILSGGSDRILRLWDVTSGYLRRKMRLFENLVGGYSFSPDGSMIAAVAGDVIIWKPSSKVPLTAIAVQKLSLIHI